MGLWNNGSIIIVRPGIEFEKVGFESVERTTTTHNGTITLTCVRELIRPLVTQATK